MRADINEDIVDILQTYNIKDKKESTTIKETLETEIKQTALKILSKNIGGGLDERLKPSSPMMIDIGLYQPQVIAIQEHQQNVISAANPVVPLAVSGYKQHCQPYMYVSSQRSSTTSHSNKKPLTAIQEHNHMNHTE